VKDVPVSKVHEVMNIKWEVIKTLSVDHLFYYSIVIFQQNPQAHWCLYPIEAQEILLHLQQFMNDRFHFHIILESLTHQVWLLQSRKTMSQDLIFHHSNETSHSAYQAQESLQLFLWELLDHLDSCLCHWRNTWEVGDFTVTRKWKWLFMNSCKCKSPTTLES